MAGGSTTTEFLADDSDFKATLARMNQAILKNQEAMFRSMEKGTKAANQQVLAKLGKGEVFGEMALLGEWPRTASVRALEEVECLGIDRWVFLAQLERQPQLAINLLLILAKRLRDTDARLAE